MIGLIQDHQLVQALQQGNQAALTQIYECYKQDLWLLALALMHDRAAAEDVVHDVYVQLVQDGDHWPSSGSLRNFLMVGLANRARNVIKSRTRRKRREGEARLVAFRKRGPMQSVILNEEMQQLAQAMAKLPYEQREVVMLHMHGKLSFTKIAEQTGQSVNTTKSRYRYALQRLRSLFDDEVS